MAATKEELINRIETFNFEWKGKESFTEEEVREILVELVNLTIENYIFLTSL